MTIGLIIWGFACEIIMTWATMFKKIIFLFWNKLLINLEAKKKKMRRSDV